MQRNEAETRRAVFFIAGGLFAASLAVADEFVHERRVPAAVPLLIVAGFVAIVAVALLPLVLDAKQRAHMVSHFRECASMLGLRGGVTLILACVDWMFAAAVVVHFLFVGATWGTPTVTNSENVNHGEMRSLNGKNKICDKRKVSVGVRLAARSVAMRPQADPNVILQAVSSNLASYAGAEATCVVNDLLAALSTGRYKDLDLLDGVLTVLPPLRIAPNERSFEVLMEANFALGNVYEVVSLAARLGSQITTARMQRVAANAAALAREGGKRMYGALCTRA